MFISRVENDNQIQEHFQGNVSIYNPEDLNRLEKSLIIWMQEIDVIGTDVTKLSQISDMWSNGSILCVLIEKQFNTTVKGQSKKPKSENTRKANVEKCLEILRKDTKIDRKYLNSVEKIIDCDFT